MHDEIVEHAPAKLNLALHVTGRRADGYHLLDTLVVFTETGDRITVRPAERDSFHIFGPFALPLQADADNLVLRARDMLREMAGNATPVEIRLEKNLPVATGIGGGSSDAAATLRALSRFWGLSVPAAAMADAALKLGADLPMCLAARTLLASGIGEKISPVDDLPPLAIVLVNPGIPVTTPAVFRALVSREQPPLPPLPLRPGFQSLVEWLGTTRNDLEAAASTIVPDIQQTLATLRLNGAALARMSGSGATCFGLFSTNDQAAAAARAIAAARPAWYVRATRSIERVQADVAP